MQHALFTPNNALTPRTVRCVRHTRNAPSSARSTPSPLLSGRRVASASPLSSRGNRVHASLSVEMPDQPADSSGISKQMEGLSSLFGRVLDPYSRVSSNGECPVAPTSDAVWGGLGVLVTFLTLGYINTLVAASMKAPFMTGSFGTLSVLMFAAPGAPVMRPFNILFGHVVGAALGVAWCKAAVALMVPMWIAQAFAMSCLIFSMLLTGAVHPPGGAAILGLFGSMVFQDLGWVYILYPGLSGAAIIVLMGMATNYCKANFKFGVPEPKLKTA